MIQRTLGNSTLQTNYTYYDWNTQGGRLQKVTSGRGDPDPDPLQDFRYTYDDVGNVQTIEDYIVGNPQTQTFTYDSLNRLATASAAGGTNGHGDYGTPTPLSFEYDGTTGNLSKKAGNSLGYGAQSANCPDGALNKAHAAISLGTSNTYCYDLNGNMVQRKIGVPTYTLQYDAENRMTKVNNGTLAKFVYDGDGNRVQAIEGNLTTNYIGNHYEWQVNQGTTAVKKYYYAGGQRVAVRLTDGDQINLLSWIVGDHLTSTSVTANEYGTKESLLRYYVWGDVRYSEGTKPTDYTFTGQQKVESIGLMFYNSRWYDATLGRFIQADSIIPGGGQGLDRYAYVNNSPTNFTDPSGHKWCDSEFDGDCNGGSGDGLTRPRNNAPSRKIEMPIPDGLNIYGKNAWKHIQELIDYAKQRWGIDLTVLDILAFVIAQEYLGQIGDYKVWAKLLAKAYHTHCGDGAFSAECMNKFWGYMEMFLGDISSMKTLFDYWFEREESKKNLDLAKEIANVILHHIKDNRWGIDDSKCETGDRCDWHELKIGESYKGFTWASLMNNCPQELKPSPGAQFKPCSDLGIYGSYDEKTNNWAIDFIY